MALRSGSKGFTLEDDERALYEHQLGQYRQALAAEQSAHVRCAAELALLKQWLETQTQN